MGYYCARFRLIDDLELLIDNMHLIAEISLGLVKKVKPENQAGLIAFGFRLI